MKIVLELTHFLSQLPRWSVALGLQDRPEDLQGRRRHTLTRVGYPELLAPPRELLPALGQRPDHTPPRASIEALRALVTKGRPGMQGFGNDSGGPPRRQEVSANLLEVVRVEVTWVKLAGPRLPLVDVWQFSGVFRGESRFVTKFSRI